MKDFKEKYKFAILRGGLSNSPGGDKKIDSTFENFYFEAKLEKVPVGVYYMSWASTAEQGKEEALFLYDNCLKNKVFELPIFMYIENATNWGKKPGVTDAIIAFCETIKSKGLRPGVSASLYWFNKMIDTPRLKEYPKWVQHISEKEPVWTCENVEFWGNSCNGKIDGKFVNENIALTEIKQN